MEDSIKDYYKYDDILEIIKSIYGLVKYARSWLK